MKYRYVAALSAALFVTACMNRREAVDHASHDSAAANIVIPPGSLFVEADVRFVQGMIAHHGQAIAMTQMAVSHGANAQLTTFTMKMDLSQRAEIAVMQQWLRNRNQHVPDSSAHQHMAMPGMLTAEQMKQLDSAKGAAFDKLFLELMIQHHEGAIKMVADLLAVRPSPEPDLYNLAVDIDFDQRAEIEKMYEMLGTL